MPGGGQTIAQKVFAAKVGRPVEPGEVVEATADLVCFPDLGIHMFRKGWDALGGAAKVVDPERVAVAFDHKVPTDSEATAAMHAWWRAWCKEHGVTKLGDLGEQGITHQWVIERGYARPGMLLTNLDTHANTTGGVACFATAVGFDIITDLVLGFNWHIVPETVRVRLEGELRPAVSARDVVHTVNTALGPDGGVGRAIEYQGGAVARMSIDSRLTLCNGTRKIEAMTGLCAADATTVEWYRSRGLGAITPFASDDDANFVVDLQLDLSDVGLTVSPPPVPSASVPLDDVAGTPIQQAFVGSCAGGRLEDLRAAAAVLDGRRVMSGVRMIVGAASQEIYRAATRDGTLGRLVEAGAIIAPASCGACMGGPYGSLTDGEACIATSTENHPGRMGSHHADIYLASAAIVAASAIEGAIADPRPYLA